MPSQAIASSSASCKADRPPGNFISGQSFTICNIVCRDAPQEQDGSEVSFQRTRLAAHRPWPVRKWFNVEHKRRRRSNPGGAMEGSTTSEWLVTSEVAHSSHHFCCVDTSSCCSPSSHTGRLDLRRISGWDSMSDIRGRVTVEVINYVIIVINYDDMFERCSDSPGQACSFHRGVKHCCYRLSYYRLTAGVKTRKQAVS